MKGLIFFALVSAQLSSTSAGASEATKLGRTVWAGFTCATYAELSKQSEEQRRLFGLAHDAGVKLVDGLLDQTITPKDLSDTPIAVTSRLQGPNADFIVGRIFEAAMNEAFDNVVKRDAGGSEIKDPAHWVMEPATRELDARIKFQNANCELVGR
ncbi:hypothetical protein [Aestuariivirga sp.]|uniref:hypothetical protein n=1 Tax=Aestuariivirga sp. TaxID=2650926 RepID=UPI0039E52EC6